MRILTVAFILIFPASAVAQNTAFSTTPFEQRHQGHYDKQLDRAVKENQLEFYERQNYRREQIDFSGMFQPQESNPNSWISDSIQKGAENSVVDQRVKEKLSQPYWAR